MWCQSAWRWNLEAHGNDLYASAMQYTCMPLYLLYTVYMYAYTSATQYTCMPLPQLHSTHVYLYLSYAVYMYAFTSATQYTCMPLGFHQKTLHGCFH